jgi:hypothetical protein
LYAPTEGQFFSLSKKFSVVKAFVRSENGAGVGHRNLLFERLHKREVPKMAKRKAGTKKAAGKKRAKK